MISHVEMESVNASELFGDMSERKDPVGSLKITTKDLVTGMGREAWDHRGYIIGAAVSATVLLGLSPETTLAAPPMQGPTTEKNALVDAIDMFRRHPSSGIWGMGIVGAIWGVGWGSFQVFQSAVAAEAAAAEARTDIEKYRAAQMKITLKGAIAHVLGSTVRETFEWGSIAGIGALGINYFDKMQGKPFTNEDIVVMIAGGSATVFALRDALSSRI